MTKSYIWVFRGCPSEEITVVYQYHPTRSGKVHSEFVKDYHGYIQTDAHKGYDATPLKMPSGCLWWAGIMHNRKNWLFSGHPDGATASATIYSLIETAKANGLKPYFYLRYLFERLPLAEIEEDYRKLLPQNYTPQQIALPAQ